MKTLFQNVLTGMVAVIALDGIGNRKKGDVFGLPPKDAAKYIHDGLVKDVPKDELPEKIKYKEVTVNLDAGIVDDDKPLSTAALSGLAESELEQKKAEALAEFEARETALAAREKEAGDTVKNALAQVETANEQVSELQAELEASKKEIGDLQDKVENLTKAANAAAEEAAANASQESQDAT